MPAFRAIGRPSRIRWVRIEFEQRAELLAAEPDVYYITDHYEDYPAVLVRLARVKPNLIVDLLGMAHRFVAAEAAQRGKNGKRR